jgi:manganese/iron transport system ATP-binding protein
MFTGFPEDITKHNTEFTNKPARININNISVIYNEKPALDGVSLVIPNGQQVAVVGPNGAGKSTLFKVLVGLIKPDHGNILIHEKPLGMDKTCVAYVPQREEVDLRFPVTVREVVLMGRYQHFGMMGKPDGEDNLAVESAMEKLGITNLAKSSLGELSGGQLQRVFLARAIAQEPHILIMDEPFNGVDVSTQEATFQLLMDIRPLGVTVLVSTHDLNMASKRFDTIMLLNHRLVAYGDPNDVMSKENLTAAFGGQMFFLDGAVVVDECCPPETAEEGIK